MQALFKFATLLLRCVLAFFRSRGEQTIVELALRQQLAAYVQARPRPRLTSLDRAFWVAIHQLWPRWREVLVIVKPETVIRWHRKGFRLYWRTLSRRGPGRPRVPQELRELIRRFAFENGWGARKIQGELSKLGFTISLATVSRYLPKRYRIRAGASAGGRSSEITRTPSRRWTSASSPPCASSCCTSGSSSITDAEG